MFKFDHVDSIEITEGKATTIVAKGQQIWTNIPPITYNYVTFGDSIAAGHRIDENWETDYGWDSQCGVGGRTETVLVPNCFTDLIQKDLRSVLGEDVSVTSFARSGDRVDDLLEKLTHSKVIETLKKADYVTICIGANNVLDHALAGIADFIQNGDESTVDAQVAEELVVLADDSASTSYFALFNKLVSINPNAKYVFTTIYNPYKYLYVDGGHDGFFKPILDTIPQMTILGFEVDKKIKDGLLSAPAMSDMINNINRMHDISEGYVTDLNAVLRNKLMAFRASHPNFFLADTKAVFDSVPDRPVDSGVHYSDLVNCQFTRGYNTADIRWYPLWKDKYGENYQQYWWDLALKYTSLESGFDMSGFAADFANQVFEKIMEPNFDPHPRVGGQYVLKRSFVDALGLEPLKTITYDANGGTGSMSQQKVVDKVVFVNSAKSVRVHLKSNMFTPPATGGYYAAGKWNNKADGGGAEYSDGEAVYVDADMTLYAQWSNLYTVTVRYSYDLSATGRTEPSLGKCALYISGSEQPDGATTYRLPYGTSMGVIAQEEEVWGSTLGKSYIEWNGEQVDGLSDDARWGFNLERHLDIHFVGHNDYELAIYWTCHITTY